MRIIDYRGRNIVSTVIDSTDSHIARPLDRLRVVVLQMTLKNRLLRKIYCDRAVRLGLNFVLLSFLYLIVSVKWSIVLLVLGPLVLGYPHLVASYRFLQKPGIVFKAGWGTSKVFQSFLFLTVMSLAIRFIGTEFNLLPKLPYGTWEILLSLVALGVIRVELKSIRSILLLAFTLVSIGLVLKLAWYNPLAFVGIALIFHNWVGFGHWFLASKDLKNRIVVVLATLIFGIVHVAVFFGALDAWISIPEINFLSARSFEVSGWALAPWSIDPKIWDRALVLYAFGLSLHYFIWLRAIPQSLDNSLVPNSYRRSLELLRKDCGYKTTTVLLAGVVLIVAMWFFASLAGKIYFGIAMLHGWLELTFLIVAAFSALLKIKV